MSVNGTFDVSFIGLSHDLLVSLDLEPAASLSCCVITAHSWVSDVLILFGLIRVIWRLIRVRSFLGPERIVTPAAASFDE